jgi:hypothetical protein
MQDMLAKAAHDVSDEPRDESGKWTDGGGGDGGGGGKDEGDGKGKHPGKGYSAGAYVDSKGVIHTNSVYDAQRALFEDRKVELKQVKQISTLIKRLGETAKEMAEHGETAPVFNLCNVSVKGTNLFCADQIGIPRVEMPVIRAGATKDFIKYLKKQGYAIEKGKEKAANLRATQNEISGVKVAAAMEKIKDRGFYKRLVVSRDDYILDGHHTWAGQLGIDAQDNNLDDDKEVKIARVDISITKLIAEAEKWTGGAGKKPASEAPKGYRLISMRQAQQELDPTTYQKFADVAYKFLAANGHLARGFDDFIITVPDIKEWDEGKHPREPAGSPTGGEFASGGGGGAAGESPETATEPKLDPDVIKVGGDEWNRATAKRLETEYQKARPAVDKLAQDAPGETAAAVSSYGEDEDEEDEDFIPEEWDQLSGDQQETAKGDWMSANESSYIDSEQQNWYDSGGALDDAKYVVANDYDSNSDWAQEALKDYREESGERIPYTDKQILNSISMTYDTNGEGTNDPEIDFDDSKLQEPIGYDPKQGTLPGIEPKKPEEYLTDEMREGIIKALQKAFDKEADNKSSSMEAPDYLADNAKEFMDEQWEHGGMSDEDKFEWTKNHTDLIAGSSSSSSSDDDAVSVVTDVEALPEKFDPLNDTSGRDYKRTQQLARYLSVKRGVEVLANRPAAAPEIAGTEKGSDKWKAQMEKRLARADSRLWTAWKQSSTSQDGKLLQVAAAAELGGRLNKKTRDEIGITEMKNYADSNYSNVGGWSGVLAYVRAKWEVTQYLLDKAGIKTLNLYRGISFSDHATYQKLLLRHYDAGHDVEGYRHMPTLDVLRNGAASTTTDPSVANDWGGGDRVVLRAEVPRTAALSVPAYGINIKSEHEVVVTGTAWRGWDAWAQRAPTFDQVPLKIAA